MKTKIKQDNTANYAIGFAYAAIMLYIMLVYSMGMIRVLLNPFLYILPLIFFVVRFNEKYFILDEENPEQFITQYEIMFVFKIIYKKPIRDFSSIALRVIKIHKESFDFEGVYAEFDQETYIALIGWDKKEKEKVEICKGSKKELNYIIKYYIQPLGIPVFLGAPKKGYEYIL